MTKKSKINVNGSTVTLPNYNFKKQYNAWKNKLSGISNEKIASTGSPYVKEGGSKRGPYPENLYLQLKEHVRKFLRAGSSNTGNDGLFEVLEEIEELLLKRKYITADDLEKLELYVNAIAKIEDNEKLNPRNTLFTRPTDWKIAGKSTTDSRAKNKIQILDEKPQEIYGHYRDNFFEDKYGVPEKKKWWSTELNTANPPLAQAIFGKGDLVTVGLLEILNKAIDELEKKPIGIQLKVQRNADSLALIPSVRKQIFALLKRTDLFSNGKPKLKQMASILSSMEFVVGDKSYGARSASPSRIITFVGNLPEFAGPTEVFSLKPFGPNVMANLIMKVIGRKTYKLKNGNYLDIKGKTEVPKEVKKSWMELLWRD